MISLFDSAYILGPTILIAHASYELERSLHVPSLLFCNNTIPDEMVAIASSKTLEKSSRYAESFSKLCSFGSKTLHFEPIVKGRAELIGMLFDFELFLKNASITPFHKFIIDISTFPKDRLWVIVDLLCTLFPKNEVLIAYTEPEIYNTEESIDGWLSKGVSDVAPIPGFNGRQDPTKPTLLIMNIGHENERVTITINNREPQKIILLSQSSSQHNTLSGETSKKILRKLQDNYGSIVEKQFFFEVDSHDPFAVRDRVNEISNLFQSDYNISVAMFGTKIQSIGALLACRRNRRIEAVYAKPQLYHHENYSKGIGKTWIATIYHSDSSELVE